MGFGPKLKKMPKFWLFFNTPPPYHLSGEIRKLLSKKWPFLAFYSLLKVKCKKNASISMFFQQYRNTRLNFKVLWTNLREFRITNERWYWEGEKISHFSDTKRFFSLSWKNVLPSKMIKIPQICWVVYGFHHLIELSFFNIEIDKKIEKIKKEFGSGRRKGKIKKAYLLNRHTVPAVARGLLILFHCCFFCCRCLLLGWLRLSYDQTR